MSAPGRTGVAAPRMSEPELEDLAAFIVRHPGVRAEAQRSLAPELFADTPDERPFRLLVATFYRMIQSTYPTGVVPYRALMHELAIWFAQRARPGRIGDDRDAELRIRMFATPNDVDGEAIAEPGLLWWIYHCAPDGEFDAQFGFSLLKKFLNERTTFDRMRQLTMSSTGGAPVDLGALVAALHTAHQRIEAIGTSAVSKPMPADFTFDPIVLYPTGTSYIDGPLGGIAAGDVNGIIGGMGQGKTTMMVDMACALGRRYNDDWIQGGRAGRRKVVVIATYEEPDKTIRPRIWSRACAIDKRTCEEMTGFDQLSTLGDLKPYEVAMYRERGITEPALLLGERERFEDGIRVINDTVLIFDMTKPGLGGGGAAELAAQLRRYAEEEGVEYGCVFIDHCLAATSKIVDNTPGMTYQKDMRALVHYYPKNVRDAISQPFNCAAFVMQQLPGQATAKSPTAKMHYSDSAESKNFAEYLTVCINMGMVDPATKCIVLTYSKARRSEMQGHRGIVQLQGKLARLVAADNDYTFEGDVIAKKNDYERFHGIGDAVADLNAGGRVHGGGFSRGVGG